LLVCREERPPRVDLESAGDKEKKSHSSQDARVTVDERSWVSAKRRAATIVRAMTETPPPAASARRRLPPADESADTHEPRTVKDVVREHGCPRWHG